MALYEATDGPNWTNSENWLSDKPIGEWYGVGTDVGERIWSLGLDGNGLRGELPRELGNLSDLRYLGLSDNRLSGEIPRELGHLTNLSMLMLHGNRLSGEIPPELGNLTYLEMLFLNDNELSGEIPGELGNISLLFLEFDGNRLSGCVPDRLREFYVIGHIESPTIELPFCGAAPGAPSDEMDRQVLITLYGATDGPNWTNSDNWLSDEPIGGVARRHRGHWWARQGTVPGE